MTRPLRIEFEGAIHHVYSTGTPQFLAADDRDRETFVSTLGEMCARFGVLVHAYVLMPDHYHILLTTPKANLSRGMQWLGTAYSRRVNARHGQTGRLFAQRFRSFLVEDATFLPRLSAYIHRNPVRAGLAKGPADYAWSSFPAYCGRAEAPAWLDRGALLSAVPGKDPAARYAAMVRKTGADAPPVWNKVRHGAFYGSASFADRMKKRSASKEIVPCGPWPEMKEPPVALGVQLSRAGQILGVKHKGHPRAHTRRFKDFLILYLYGRGRYSNSEIGDLFGVSGSAVSHRVKSAGKRMAKDLSLAAAYAKFVRKMGALCGEAPPAPENAQSVTLPKIHSLAPDAEISGSGKRLGPKGKQMRWRLINATLDCLQKYGYHGATLSRILARAGISRGGWQYHFSSKKELIAAAADHIYENAFRMSLESAGDPSVKALVEKQPFPLILEFIWENFHQGWHRDVWLEITIACRTDEALREQVIPVIRKFFNSIDAFWQENFQTRGKPVAPVQDLLNLMLYAMRGMSIQSIVHDTPDQYASLRETLGRILLPLFESKNG